MNVTEGQAFGQAGFQKGQFRLQGFHIGRDRPGCGRALRPAGTEPAQAAAKRHMHVKGNRDGRVQSFQPAVHLFCPDRVGKMGCGRVARVTGDTSVKKPKLAELRVFVHKDTLYPNSDRVH